MARKSKKRSFDQLDRVFREVYNDNNFCGPLNTCVLTGQSVGKVRKVYQKLGRLERTGSTVEMIVASIEHFGYNVEVDWDANGKQFRSVATTIDNGFIICSNSKVAHVSAIRNGEIVDYREADSRKRVLCIGRVSAK
jgi:hypothetical protein